MADRRTDKAGLAAGLTGGGLLVSAPYTGDAINAAHRADTARRVRRLGSTGALDENKRPVPRTGPGAPARQAGHRGGQQGRGKSPRLQAIERYQIERAKLSSRRVPIRGKRGLALGIGQSALGAGLLGYGASRFGQRASEVGKAAFAPEDSMWLTSQDLVGIPRSRSMPVDPLAMKASSSIMAGILTGASGRSLSRRQKKRIQRGALQFVGAQHQVVVPTGMRGLVTS